MTNNTTLTPREDLSGVARLDRWKTVVLLALAFGLPAAAAVAAAGFYTLAPCRIADTRDPAGDYGGPALAASGDRTFVIAGRCGIPSSAEAIALNVTVTGASAAASLRLYPSGQAVPQTTGINYSAGKTRANNGSYGIGSGGGLAVHSDQGSGSVHLILDVFGYYESAVAPPPPPPPPPPPGDGTYAWSTHFGGPTLAVDSATPVGIVVDGWGGTVVVGYLKGKADFGGGMLTSAGAGDIYLVKYSSTGSYQWSQRFGGSLDDRPKGIGIDLAGNIFVTGYFRGTASFGGAALTAGTGCSNGFVAKYSSSGGHVWSKRLATGAGIDTGDAITVDGSGNAIVGASLYATSDFGGGPLTSAGGQDIVLVKYNSSGAHVWSRRIGGTSADAVTGVAADMTTGEVVAVGYFAGTVDFGGGNRSSAGGNDGFAARYSSSGSHLWSRSWGNTSEDKSAAVAVDSLGNAVVTGMFTDNVDFGGGAIANLGGAGSGDIFLVEYSVSGDHRWSKGFGSSLTLNEMAYGVNVDRSDNVVLTGAIVGTINFGGGAQSGDGWYNAFLAKFDSAGSHFWSKRYSGGNGNSNGRAVAVDAGSNVLSAGDYDSTINFGGSTLTSPGAADTYLLKVGP